MPILIVDQEVYTKKEVDDLIAAALKASGNPPIPVVPGDGKPGGSTTTAGPGTIASPVAPGAADPPGAGPADPATPVTPGSEVP